MIKKRQVEEVIEDVRIYNQDFEKNYYDGYSDSMGNFAKPNN